MDNMVRSCGDEAPYIASAAQSMHGAAAVDCSSRHAQNEIIQWEAPPTGLQTLDLGGCRVGLARGGRCPDCHLELPRIQRAQKIYKRNGKIDGSSPEDERIEAVRQAGYDVKWMRNCLRSNRGECGILR